MRSRGVLADGSLAARARQLRAGARRGGARQRAARRGARPDGPRRRAGRRLHLRGEHEFPVPPLALPEPDGRRRPLAGSPAVALFLDRAQRGQAGLRADGRERGGGRRDLPPPRRSSARDRARGGAREAALAAGDPRPARRTGSTSSPAARATCPRGSERSATRSTGATTCSSRPSRRCSRRLGRLRRRLHARGGRGGLRRQREQLGEVFDGLAVARRQEPRPPVRTAPTASLASACSRRSGSTRSSGSRPGGELDELAPAARRALPRARAEPPSPS